MGEISGVAYKIGYYGYYCGKLVGKEESDRSAYSPTATDDDDEENYRRRLLRGNITTMDMDMASTYGATSCLPDFNEYIFEVIPSDDTMGECCGFDPDSFVVKFDNSVVMQRVSDSGGRTFFPEQSEPCPSAND